MTINKINLIIANCKDTTIRLICKGKTYFYNNATTIIAVVKKISKKIVQKQMKSQKFPYLC